MIGLAIVGCGQIVTHHLSAIFRILDNDGDNNTMNETAAEKQSSSNNIDDTAKVFYQHRYQIRALVDPNPVRRNVVESLITSNMINQFDHNDIKHYDSMKNLFDDDICMNNIDIIFIAVPHDLHEVMAIEAIEYCCNSDASKQRGKVRMIILEKPLAPTSNSCIQLLQKSKVLLLAQSSVSSKSQQKHNTDGSSIMNECCCMLMIAEQSPYWEEVMKAKELIQNGKIGNIITASSYYYESMRNNITSGSLDNDGCGLGWRGSLKRAGGGIIIDGGLHWIRPITEMLPGTKINKVIGVIQSNIQPQLQMEGESLGHAIFELSTTDSTCPYIIHEQPTNNQNDDEEMKKHTIYVTYSANMLSTGPMAYDCCPYFRITGTDGEIIIYGTGLLSNQSGSGGLKLYNHDHIDGIDLFPSTRLGGFFHGFYHLWNEITRVYNTNDYHTAHESVVRACNDVHVVLALYRSHQTKQWENTNPV